ncbi:MAG TPA: FUN14 domain-containing protein [Planctomycetota bacterium]|nr:FUN14 domain-containing protein [Planctomycetota bacterium]
MKFLQTLFRTGFTELSLTKKWLLRLALSGLVVGGAFQAWSLWGDAAGGEGYSLTAFRSGLGFVAGFLIGVAARIFFKVTALVGLGLAVLGYGLQKLGVIDLPWDSLGDVVHAFGSAVQHNTDRFLDFLTSYLPAGLTSFLGLGSGVTQKPRFDED